MASRWFNVTVVLFWLTTMGWLVENKILPSWIVGEPPTYRTILDDPALNSTPVGWSISLDDRPLGWAISRAEPFDQGGHQLRSRIHLSRMPVEPILPGWMGFFVRNASFDVDAATSIGVDSFGHPLDIRTVADFNYPGFRPAGALPDLRVSFRGVLDGDQLKLMIRAGDSVTRTTVSLPPDALMGDAFSPHARLPGLRIGQTWTVPAYALRPTTNPVEVLHATVEGHETIDWHERATPTLVIVLRSDPGAGLSTASNVRGKTWVASDGLVLKQELLLGQSRLTFERIGRSPNRKLLPQAELSPWWPLAKKPEPSASRDHD